MISRSSFGLSPRPTTSRRLSTQSKQKLRQRQDMVKEVKTFQNSQFQLGSLLEQHGLFLIHGASSPSTKPSLQSGSPAYLAARGLQHGALRRPRFRRPVLQDGVHGRRCRQGAAQSEMPFARRRCTEMSCSIAGGDVFEEKVRVRVKAECRRIVPLVRETNEQHSTDPRRCAAPDERRPCSPCAARAHTNWAMRCCT